MVNSFLSYNQPLIDKYNKGELVPFFTTPRKRIDDVEEKRSDDVEEKRSDDEEKSFSDTSTVILRGKSAKNWERNRARMIKNLNEGKSVKESTMKEYGAKKKKQENGIKYDSDTGIYY